MKEASDAEKVAHTIFGELNTLYELWIRMDKTHQLDMVQYMWSCHSAVSDMLEQISEFYSIQQLDISDLHFTMANMTNEIEHLQHSRLKP